MTKKTWTPGKRLTAVEALTEIAEGRPVFWGHKWTANGWARSWQIHMLVNSANRGKIFEALKIKDQRNEH